MNALKTMLVTALGLGITWAAWEIAPGSSSGMLTAAAVAQEPANEVASEDLSEEEIAAALERVEAAMAEKGEVKEFKPSEPLPADVSIDMSSEL